MKLEDAKKMRDDAMNKGAAFQVIASSHVEFEDPHPDVHVAKIFIANASWVNTTEGIVVVDTLLNPIVAEKMKQRMAETGGPWLPSRMAPGSP